MHPPLTAVICRSPQQFRDWCREQGLNPRDPSLRCITEWHQARGCWFDDIVQLYDGDPQLIHVVRSRVRVPA